MGTYPGVQAPLCRGARATGGGGFFLNPPVGAPVENGVKLERVQGIDAPGGITLVHWNRRTPRLLRFKAMPLYKWLIKQEIRKVERAIGAPIDLLWSFEPNTFPDLAAFRANHSLFMPVDPLSLPAQVHCAAQSDLIVSVSNEILANFAADRFGGRTLLVDHGISRAFEAEAQKPAPPRRLGAPVHAGFFGNLDRPIVNHRVFAQLARDHRDVQFHFWGPFNEGGPFDRALGGHSNVIAHGPLGKAELVQAVRSIDVFPLIYGVDEHTYDRSNAHKILEYLCMGKVIVSSQIARYRGRPDLLRSPASGDDDDIPALFAQTLTELDHANAPEKIGARKAYALQHTYRAQLQRIEAALAARVTAKRAENRAA